MASLALLTGQRGELPLARAALQPQAMKIRLFKQTSDAAQSDAALFARFLAGDDAAFTTLYSAHNQRVFNYAAKIVHDHAAASDIVHAMWERVIRMRASKQEKDTIANPIGLFVRIARNLALDHLKHHAHQTAIESAGELHAAATNDDEQLVLHAIEQLPEETRQILLLHYYSGYDLNEIAAMLGKKPNAIWTRVSRARAELKKILARELEGVKL
jgi:RNA polymerase sigma-70 factor (ECF subfamily)